MLNRSLGKLYVYLDEHDSNLRSTYELTEGENFIGGSLFCDVKLAYANIAELHCKITLTPQGEYSIEDLSNLSHGIYRVTPKNSRQKLKPNKEYELLPERPFYLTNLYKCVFKPQVQPGIPKIFRTGSSLPAHDQEEEEIPTTAATTERKRSVEEPIHKRETEKVEKVTAQSQKPKKNLKKIQETETIKEPQPQESEKVQTPAEVIQAQKPSLAVPVKEEKVAIMEEEPQTITSVPEKTEKEKNLIQPERVEPRTEEEPELKQQIKKKKPEPPKEPREVAKPKKEPEIVKEKEKEKEKVEVEAKNASPKIKKHIVQEQPPVKEKHEKIVKETPPKEKKEVQKERVEHENVREKEETKLQLPKESHPPLKEAASPAFKSKREEEKLPPLQKNALEKRSSTGSLVLEREHSHSSSKAKASHSEQSKHVKPEIIKELKSPLTVPIPVIERKESIVETKPETSTDMELELLDDYKLKKQSETAALHKSESSSKKEKEKSETEHKRSHQRHEDDIDFLEDDAFEEGLVENEPEKYEPKPPRLDYRRESLEIKRRDTDEKDYGYRRDYRDQGRPFDRDREKRRDQDRDREKGRDWIPDREREFEREMERDRERGIDRRRDDRDFRMNRARDRDEKSERMMPSRDKVSERREEGELNIIKRRKDDRDMGPDSYRRQDDKRDYRYGRDDKDRDLMKEGRLDIKQDLRRQDSRDSRDSRQDYRQDSRHRDDRQLERKNSSYEENKFGRGPNYGRPHDSHRPGQGYDRLNIVKRDKDSRDFRPDNRMTDPQLMPPKRPMDEKPEEDKKELDVMQNFPHYLAPFHQPAPPPRELRKDQPPPPREAHKDSKGKDEVRSERDFELARGKSSHESRYPEPDYNKSKLPPQRPEIKHGEIKYNDMKYSGAKSADKGPSEEKVQTPIHTGKTEEEPISKPEGNFELTRRKSMNETRHPQELPKVKPPQPEEIKEVRKPEDIKEVRKPEEIKEVRKPEETKEVRKPVVHEEPPASSSTSGKMEIEPQTLLKPDFELTRKKSGHEQRPPKVDNSKGKIAQKLEIKQMNRAVEEKPEEPVQEASHPAEVHRPDPESLEKYEKAGTTLKKHKPNPEPTTTPTQTQTPAETTTVSGKTSATQGKTTAGKEETKEVAHAHDRGGAKGRAQQYYVMFSGFDREDKEVEDCKKKLQHLGLKIVEERERTFNVLVLKKFKRTIKFLLAVIKGVDIVSFDWVRACTEQDRIVPPSQYTFCDKAAESKFNFKLGATIQKARQMSHGFLKGFKVYFPYDIKPSYEEMKFLAESADGICIRNRPLQFRDDIVIILNQGDKRNAESFSEIGFVPYTSELLFSGILQQDLHFEEHKLI